LRVGDARGRPLPAMRGNLIVLHVVTDAPTPHNAARVQEGMASCRGAGGRSGSRPLENCRSTWVVGSAVIVVLAQPRSGPDEGAEKRAPLPSAPLTASAVRTVHGWDVSDAVDNYRASMLTDETSGAKGGAAILHGLGARATAARTAADLAMSNRTVHGDMAKYSTSGRTSPSASIDVTKILHEARARSVRGAETESVASRPCIPHHARGLTGRGRDGAGRACGTQQGGDPQDPGANAAGDSSGRGACAPAALGAITIGCAWPRPPALRAPWP
jgi:hypothetical protein